MRIRMMSSDDITTVDRAFNPYDDTKFRHYLRERYESKMGHLSRLNGNESSEFMKRTERIFEQYNNEGVLRKARAVNRANTGKRRGNIIHDVRDLSELRTAGVTMQRYAMAHIDTREDFLKQKIDGWSDSYKNLHGNDVGRKHYDWRRATQGRLITERNEQGENEFVFVRHYDQLLDGDRELFSDEQDVIADTWELLDMCRAAGIDGTDVYQA